jgi:hypothetical protein
MFQVTEDAPLRMFDTGKTSITPIRVRKPHKLLRFGLKGPRIDGQMLLNAPFSPHLPSTYAMLKS